MRAKGIDISYAQKGFIAQPHQDFVIAKACNGVIKDIRFDQHSEAAEDGGKLIGAYLYMLSGLPWQEQADALVYHAPNAHFYAVDFEKKGNTASAYFAWNAKYTVFRIKDVSRKRVLFYSSPSVIQDWMFKQKVYWVRDYEDLWIAQWPYKGWNDVLLNVPDLAGGWSPRLPAGCVNWKVWQYSGDWNRRGSLEGTTSRDTDTDVFNGTKTEMYAWANVDTPVGPVEPVTYTWNQSLELLKGRLDDLKD